MDQTLPPAPEVRKRAVDQARARATLAGTILPAVVEELNQRYIDGEISVHEHLRRVLEVARLNGG